MDEARLSSLLSRLSYVRGDYGSEDLYDRLAQSLSAHTTVLAYLAVPPTVFTDVACGLMKTELRNSVRLLIEKPFGTNLATAQQLANEIDGQISEDRVFPIDHFLQKESVQNLLVLRFANRIFEPTWSKDHIASVAVTVAEDFGIEGVLDSSTRTARCAMWCKTMSYKSSGRWLWSRPGHRRLMP